MSASASSQLLSEAFLDLQFYERALDLFEDDPSLSVILHKHLLKTVAAPTVEKLIQTLVIENKLKNEIEVDGENLDDAQRTSSNLISLAKSLPDSLAVKAQAVVEALEGERVDAFVAPFNALAEESGLKLKKLDKQLEVYNKALKAPESALSAVLSRLKDKLPEQTFKVLKDYHGATDTLLALQSAATEDETDCSADRILSKKEYLESKMPVLKSLVLETTNSEA